MTPFPRPADVLRAPEPPPSGHGLPALIGRVEAAVCAPVAELGEHLGAALAAAATDADLVPAHLRAAACDRYARHILHADAAGRFTIVALVWGAGQFSPVHAHHTWCAYAVLDGTLTETAYRLDAASGLAVPIATERLAAGSQRFEYAGLAGVHKLGNAEDNIGLSLHIYGIDGARVGSHVNRLVPPAHH